MRNNPLIFAGCAVKRQKANPDRTKGTNLLDDTPTLEATEQNGELLICDLCQNGTGSVHDMRVINTYDKSHLAKTP